MTTPENLNKIADLKLWWLIFFLKFRLNPSRFNIVNENECNQNA